MGNFNRPFNRDNRGGGGRSFDRNSPREMHRTTCSNCGNECEVPFKPNGSKPVFCSNCFEKNGGEQRRSNDRDYAAPRRDDRRPSFNENRSFDRPQYSERPQNDRPQNNNNDQFASLNAKLDRIITLLTPKPEYKAEEESNSEAAVTESAEAPKEKKARAPRKAKVAPVEESAE